jgi:uncharacterized protein (TIGR02145 family)
MLYQWNRSTGWYDNAGTLTGVLKGGGTTTSWDSSYSTDETDWASDNDPSPAGWRVPTLDEIHTLFDEDEEKVSYEWTACNGVCGGLFTDKTTGKSLFLPAAGLRDDYDGTLYEAGAGGYYCCGTLYDINNALNLYVGHVTFMTSGGVRSYGWSVRCVSEF